MKELLILLLLCHVAFAVKHSMKFYVMVSSGVPNLPDYVADAYAQEMLMNYYDSITRTIQPKQDYVRKFMEEDRKLWESTFQGVIYNELFFKAQSESLKQRLNQTADVHIIQHVVGCEWDDEDEDVESYNLYGYNGEDLLALDLQTETWIAAKPQARVIKTLWDGNKRHNAGWKPFMSNTCFMWMKEYLKYGKSVLHRKDLPTVSLLQKTPSSPVSCHATGFYPKRAVMFWRKDGEDLYEGMDQDYGEILPNHDGSFQMSVDLKVSPEEDWKKYQCVFQLSGVKEDLLTQLDKAVIRTNWKKPTDMTVPITAAVVVVALVLVAAAGFNLYNKKKKALCSPSDLDNDSELSEKLNTGT